MIVYICGSYRFLVSMENAATREREKGNEVVMGWGEAFSRADMDKADEVLVVARPCARCPECKMWRHCQGGENHVVLMRSGCCHVPMVMEDYIGFATEQKITYAKRINKPIHYDRGEFR